MVRQRRLIVFAASLVTLLTLSPSAWAVPITTNESGMDLVFSQASFGGSPIDIRFNAPRHFRNNALLHIDTPAQLITLLNLVPNGPVGPQSGPINMFFVDQLNSVTASLTQASSAAHLPYRTTRLWSKLHSRREI